MTTIGLTGAAGFVGRQILRSLLDGRRRVRLILRTGGSEIQQMADSNVEVCRTPDLFAESLDNLCSLVDGVDTLVHAAWYAEPGEYLTSPVNLDCLSGTLRLAQAFQSGGGRRFLGIGTCFEYDLHQGILGVDTPLKPGSLYAACKASAYQVLNQLLPARDTEFLWCRLFYLYGPGEDPRRLAGYLHQKLAKAEAAELTSGRQIRDFLDVREAGSMIVQEALGNRQGAVNICSGVPMTVRQLAEHIADGYGRRDLLRFGARPDNLVDPSCVVGLRE